MAQQHCLVEFSFPEPAGLFRGEENLDSHILPSPLSFPHLPIAPFADAAHQMNLLRNGSLDLHMTDKITPQYPFQVWS